MSMDRRSLVALPNLVDLLAVCATHADAAGETIRNDCGLCHTIVAQGKGAAAAELKDNLVFEHPEDIGEMWMEMPCTDCHTGAGAGM